MVGVGPVEGGVISSVNDTFIFVLFDSQVEGSNGKACYPGHLDFLPDQPK